MQPIYVGIALCAGAALPLQALINARLAKLVGGPVWAATISFLVGTMALLLFQTVSRVDAPALTRAAAAPPWVWLGGVLGAVYVTGATMSVPRLGAAALVALVVFAQMMASLVLDHFSVLLPEPQPITLLRVLGAVLLVIGVVLVTRY